MKKLLLLILLIVMGFTLSGCLGNKVIPNEGKIELYLDPSFQEYMHYEEVPSFTLEFLGTIYTIEHVPSTNYTIFASNDDFILSEILLDLFEEYQDAIEFEIASTERAATTRMNARDENNKAIPTTLVVDDEQLIYEVAYISLENGLKLSLDYRRFVSEGKTYIAWRYTSNISMFLYFPLMVAEIDGTKELLLLALPSRIAFQVGPQLKLDNLMRRSDYLQDTKYSFGYRSDQDTIEAQQNYVKAYYIDNHQGNMQGDMLHFHYLDVEYAVEFFDNVFTIHFVGKG